MSQIQVRLLKNHEEFQECERIQKAVWGVVAASRELMSVIQKYGGAVLGAFVNRRMVGFILAFLARRKSRLIHWSHMMAVEPGFRDLGLGLGMKLAHRRLALQQGIKSICWTYDPLQSRNATLNIFRLGAQVEEYIPDCYGHFPSRIEKGLPSDRFVVNWHIDSRRVAHRLRRRLPNPPNFELPQANETRLNAQKYLENRRLHLNLGYPRLLVEIPANTDEMRARSLPLARRWRFEARKVFEHYFSAGYQVQDFIPPSGATLDRCYYLLRQALVQLESRHQLKIKSEASKR